MRSTSATEVRVCDAQELSPGELRRAGLGLDPQGLPVLALVVRDRSGRIHAYRNLCRHLPVPLDASARGPLSDDGRHLVCRTHGATYRLKDGYCVEGPCKGMSLHPLRWFERDGALYVSFEAA